MHQVVPEIQMVQKVLVVQKNQQVQWLLTHQADLVGLGLLYHLEVQ